jgi:hypothetical protein
VRWPKTRSRNLRRFSPREAVDRMAVAAGKTPPDAVNHRPIVLSAA